MNYVAAKRQEVHSAASSIPKLSELFEILKSVAASESLTLIASQIDTIDANISIARNENVFDFHAPDPRE